MQGSELQLALVSPTSVESAEEWIEHVVRALGPRFLPDDGVDGFWLDDGAVEQLHTALVAARELLGERIDDLVYRWACVFLEELDPDYAVWARPVSQPPARLWLVERAGRGSPDRMELAFEDERGKWWLWEPVRDRFHDVTPGLATDFYYSGRARTDEWIEDEFQRFRFRRLPVGPAMALLDGGTLANAPDSMHLPYLEDITEIPFAQAAAQIDSSAGVGASPRSRQQPT